MPEHVAIIMDGNGRWAKKKGMNRVFGHSQAVGAVRDSITFCGENGIKVLTLYAFSTENWRRPKEETDFLLNLITKFINEKLGEILKNNVKICWIGRRTKVPESVRQIVEKAEKESSENTGLIVNFAFDYGSRYEIIEAVRRLAEDAKSGAISPEDIDEELFSSRLFTAGQPDPDLIIRTSGEHRISNFLLWQAAYSELIFINDFWPDFNKELMMQAIVEFNRRTRRLGGI